MGEDTLAVLTKVRSWYVIIELEMSNSTIIQTK